VRIEIVQLENIRSHLKSTVPLARGFNCLVGGLGCGKSSVLYSVDFAFFGEPIGRSFEYLLRDDAESGKVAVQFSQNGKTYKISRGLKRLAKGISQDVEELKLFEDERIIAGLKTDAISEQFKSITGLDKGLYREIVWMRQEHLKELLDATPRERQKRLDELFGLSDYETAWSNIADYQREYEGERRALETDPDVKGMDRLSDEYNQVTGEYAILEMELQDYLEKLNKVKKDQENAEAKLVKLEEKKRTAEELERKEARLSANLSNLEEACVSLKQKIEGKKTVLANFNQRQSSNEVQSKQQKDRLEKINVPTNLTLKELDEWVLSIDEKISEMKAEKESALRNMQADKKREEALSLESRCPLCLQSLDDKYKDALAHRIQTENLERQQKAEIIQKEIAKIQATKNVATDVVSNLKTLSLRTEDLELRIEEEKKNLEEISNELVQKNEASVGLSRQLEDLRSEISRFDLRDYEEAKVQKDQAFRMYYAVDSDLRTREARKKDLLRRLDLVKERIDHAQEKIERVEKIAKTTALLSAIRDAYRSIQPRLRSEFIKTLRNFVQQVLDNLTDEGSTYLNMKIDETYTPSVISEGGTEREAANLSGGERTLLAFAYRLGLGQLIMQARTGHGLNILLLDEPTENLGSEDGSIERLAEAISKFKAIEQIVAVTHSETFAEKAEHVVKLEKENGISKVSIER
jgi:DNA repair protein SbcC/Rad50